MRVQQQLLVLLTLLAAALGGVQPAFAQQSAKPKQDAFADLRRETSARQARSPQVVEANRQASQGVDAIVIWGNREAEDIAPVKKSNATLMREKLDNAGPGLPTTVHNSRGNDGQNFTEVKRGGKVIARYDSTAGQVSLSGSPF